MRQTCPYCSQTFPNISSLGRHVGVEHTDDIAISPNVNAQLYDLQLELNELNYKINSIDPLARALPHYHRDIDFIHDRLDKYTQLIVSNCNNIAALNNISFMTAHRAEVLESRTFSLENPQFSCEFLQEYITNLHDRIDDHERQITHLKKYHAYIRRIFFVLFALFYICFCIIYHFSIRH